MLIHDVVMVHQRTKTTSYLNTSNMPSLDTLPTQVEDLKNKALCPITRTMTCRLSWEKNNFIITDCQDSYLNSFCLGLHLRWRAWQDVSEEVHRKGIKIQHHRTQDKTQRYQTRSQGGNRSSSWKAKDKRDYLKCWQLYWSSRQTEGTPEHDEGFTGARSSRSRDPVVMSEIGRAAQHQTARLQQTTHVLNTETLWTKW